MYHHPGANQYKSQIFCSNFVFLVLLRKNTLKFLMLGPEPFFTIWIRGLGSILNYLDPKHYD